MMPSYDSGSGGGGTSGSDTEDYEPNTDFYTTTSTDTSDDSDSSTSSSSSSSSTSDTYDDSIDLGHSTASGGSTKHDLENNAAGVEETSDIISEYGGPDGVYVTDYDQIQDVNEAVSEVSGDLYDYEEAQEAAEEDAAEEELPPAENPDPASEEQSMVLDPAQVLAQLRGGSGLDLDREQMQLAAVAIVVALAVVFGG